MYLYSYVDVDVDVDVDAYYIYKIHIYIYTYIYIYICLIRPTAAVGVRAGGKKGPRPGPTTKLRSAQSIRRSGAAKSLERLNARVRSRCWSFPLPPLHVMTSNSFHPCVALLDEPEQLALSCEKEHAPRMHGQPLS